MISSVAARRRRWSARAVIEPAKFCFLGALSARLSMSAWLWDLRCFLIVIVSFSRLWSLPKEGGGHPRRSRVGVAARRGNPGQEGRNQGRRAYERVSGETLVSLSSLLSLSLSLISPLLFFLSCSCCFLPTSGCLSLSSVCVTLCVCVSLSVSAFVSLGVCVLAVTQAPAALTTPAWHRVCSCLWLCVITLQSVSVFYRDSTHMFHRPTLRITIWRTLEGSQSTPLLFVILHTPSFTQ